jgi:cell division septation protein DedD
MLRSGENETEILLGNKQLLGIFFLIAVLLGIAFTGGYMIGRNGTRKAVAPAPAEAAPAPSAGAGGGETHAVSPADSSTADSSTAASQNATDNSLPDTAPADSSGNPVPLGAPKRKKPVEPQAEAETAPAVPEPVAFTPQSGQEFLQVAAVARADANEVADVLRKKGFRAHAVPTPSNPNLYRVIVGPIRDAGDLAATRDSLRKTGFRDVIVQHYR